VELGEDGGKEDGASSKKKRRIAPRAVQPKLMSRFRGADVSDVEQVRLSNVWMGNLLLLLLCFCVDKCTVIMGMAFKLDFQ
jgi:hypothetical protein